MKNVVFTQTFDGKFHETTSQAKRHLDNLRGDLILSLAKQIGAVDGKYKQTTEILDNSSEIFRKIVEIENDFALISEDEE